MARNHSPVGEPASDHPASGPGTGPPRASNKGLPPRKTLSAIEDSRSRSDRP